MDNDFLDPLSYDFETLIDDLGCTLLPLELSSQGLTPEQNKMVFGV